MGCMTQISQSCSHRLESGATPDTDSLLALRFLFRHTVVERGVEDFFTIDL